MINQIYPHRLSVQYRPGCSPGPDDLIFHFENDRILLKNSAGGTDLPLYKEIIRDKEEGVLHYLFSLDDRNCFLAGRELKQLDEPFSFTPISFFRTESRADVAWASLLAYHFKNWYSENRYCGRCGTVMEPGKEERALVCQSCGFVVYPKISPAVIVAITCNDKILLVRGNNFPGSWYSLVAGYVDIGETFEEALEREVREEVGLDISNIRYYGSQPWPLSGAMMVGFTAEADDRQQIVLDRKELVTAEWFSRDGLPPHSLSLSIAGEIIEKFGRGEL
ncbi:MAG: NAD(+) diphosphatase [Bacteroidales bacterium]